MLCYRSYLFESGTPVSPDPLLDKELLQHHLSREVFKTALHEAELILKLAVLREQICNETKPFLHRRLLIVQNKNYTPDGVRT